MENKNPILLDGKSLSKEIEANLRQKVGRIVQMSGNVPVLATILVGNDPSSEIYVKMKENACERVGMASFKVNLPEQTTTEELLTEIEKLNNDDNICGILLQHPVPKQINERACFDKIAIEKDVDFLRSAMPDKLIMKSLFERVVASSPRRCILNSKNEILIKNFRINKKQKRWIASNSILIGNYRWRYISDAKFKIDEMKGVLVYKFDIKLLIMLYIFSLILFPVITGYTIYEALGMVQSGLKIGFIIFMVYFFLNLIDLFTRYLVHKLFIVRFIKEVKK